MKTAKLVAYMAALLLLFNLSAAGQVRFGVKAGLNLANIDYKTPVDNAHDILPTFQVGGVVEIGLAEALAINTGVLLQGKGYRYTKENDAYTAKYTPTRSICKFRYNWFYTARAFMPLSARMPQWG